MTATVDTHLAKFEVEVLMTKAFELTHRIHEREQGAYYLEDVDRVRDLRDQRDAIVREMQRRSDAMERALVTVEAAEQSLRHIDATLGSIIFGKDDESILQAHARVSQAREIADMMMSRTSETYCSLVKHTALSDRVRGRARDVVKPIRERGREVRRLVLRSNV